jgi:hypothetical protein
MWLSSVVLPEPTRSRNPIIRILLHLDEADLIVERPSTGLCPTLLQNASVVLPKNPVRTVTGMSGFPPFLPFVAILIAAIFVQARQTYSKSKYGRLVVIF